MVKQLIALGILFLLVCACSDDPATPESLKWEPLELIGGWSGQLELLSIVPDSSFPFWPDYENHPLYNRRYDFRNLDVSVNFNQNDFLILLQYRSDSLFFIYEERGLCELSGGTPPYLRMDSTSVTGRLETWDWFVNWDTIGCCWQAGLDLEEADPASTGFGAEILKIFDIQSRLNISDLRLKKERRILLH